jgi:hypothetical protein
VSTLINTDISQADADKTFPPTPNVINVSSKLLKAICFLLHSFLTPYEPNTRCVYNINATIRPAAPITILVSAPATVAAPVGLAEAADPLALDVPLVLELSLAAADVANALASDEDAAALSLAEALAEALADALALALEATAFLDPVADAVEYLKVVLLLDPVGATYPSLCTPNGVPMLYAPEPSTTNCTE